MLRLHMIPTNGDATLLRFIEEDKEANILIDGGNRKNECLSYLKSQGVTKINLLIVSHLDEDHIRGLRRVADVIPVDELWIMDISPLIPSATKSLYMMKCYYESKLIMDGKKIKSNNKFTVYDGFNKQIGPFFLEVLSPPKSLYEYLRRPNVVEKVLSSHKGQSIGRYIREEIERQLRKEDVNGNRERHKAIISNVIEQFDLNIPQREDEKELFDKMDVDWKKHDRFYESARSLFNDISIVVKITFDYHGVRETFLFPGDLTNWSLVLATHQDALRGCITKVPHHGSSIHVDTEEYYNYFISQINRLDLRKLFPPPFLNSLDDLNIIFMRYWKNPFFLMPSLPGNLPLKGNLDSRGVYELLSPKHSLIYPYKSSFRLPRLDVRNVIKANSSQTSCNFKQGKVSVSHRREDEPCMDCFNCNERGRGTANMFEWK
ncbi:MAG: hypothetical protein JXB48_10570 [Candidatus Latescibacteria bacterium]|nr:hypothetical protein [Candidatus Latescibacterota bacterium]